MSAQVAEPLPTFDGRQDGGVPQDAIVYQADAGNGSPDQPFGGQFVGEVIYGEDGQPMVGKDGQPMRVGDGQLREHIFGQQPQQTEVQVTGYQGQEQTYAQPQATGFADGTGPFGGALQGQIIYGEDGMPLTGADGQPMRVGDGQLMQQLQDAGGSASFNIEVPAGVDPNQQYYQQAQYESTGVVDQNQYQAQPLTIEYQQQPDQQQYNYAAPQQVLLNYQQQPQQYQQQPQYQEQPQYQQYQEQPQYQQYQEQPQAQGPFGGQLQGQIIYGTDGQPMYGKDGQPMRVGDGQLRQHLQETGGTVNLEVQGTLPGQEQYQDQSQTQSRGYQGYPPQQYQDQSQGQVYQQGGQPQPQVYSANGAYAQSENEFKKVDMSPTSQAALAAQYAKYMEQSGQTASGKPQSKVQSYSKPPPSQGRPSVTASQAQYQHSQAQYQQRAVGAPSAATRSVYGQDKVYSQPPASVRGAEVKQKKKRGCC